MSTITSEVQSPSAKVSAWVVIGHIAAITLTQSTWIGTSFITPIVAQTKFGANKWQTLVLTATPTMLFVLSIFWNEFFRRVRLRNYLAVYWLFACMPLALMGQATSYLWLLLPHLVSCIGMAGYHPVAGELLKSLYPDKVRGRVYSLLWGVSSALGAATGFVVGHWLDHSESAYRVIMPIASGLQLGGIGLFLLLSTRSGHAKFRNDNLARAAEARRATHLVAPDKNALDRVRQLLSPIMHMGRILKEDPVFARYEAAYMTYGIGWMICAALLPLFGKGFLGLSYEQYANSTHVAYWIAIVLILVPAGMLMDKVGPVRSTALSFGLLSLYPIGLMFVTDYHQMIIVSVVYGFAHAGASMGWMLGPVALAPTPEKVPQYVSIHSTLVGVRGAVFQLLGVGLLWLTGKYSWPFALAAAAFVWSCWQMWQLHGVMQARRQAAETQNSSEA